MRYPLAIAVLVLLTTSLAPAQTPTNRLIPYTGTVTDDTGSPVHGTVTMVFELYEEQEGGAALWRETQQVQPDDRGRYLVYLGAVTPFPQIAFTEERARWLAVAFNGKVLPRVMLVAVPYALRAADAETLGGKPVSAFVTTGPDGRLRTTAGVVGEPLIDGMGTPGQIPKFTTAATVGDSTITESATNRIGIGTTDPTEGGALDSKVTIRTNDGTTALAIANQAGVPRFALNVNGDGSWITYDRALGTFQPGIAQRGGRVGISTTDPTGGGVVDSKFTVRNLDNNSGIAVLNQSNARRFALNTLATGAWTMYDGVGNIWRPGLSQHTGNVGIGTATPTQKLEVNGNLRFTTLGNAIQFADGSVITTGVTGQVFFQVSQSAPFTPPTGSGVTLNPAGYTTIMGMSMNVTVPAQSFLVVTSYGDVANTDGGTVRADVAVFIDDTFNFTIHPPRSLTVGANGFTPYSISFAIALPAGVHNFSLRGQNYAGATPGVFGQTSPGLLTVTVVKQ